MPREGMLPDPSDEPHSPAPDWVRPKTVLIADGEDLVTRRRFRVWYDEVEANLARSRLRRRRRPLPFLIENAETGRLVTALRSWGEVVSWYNDAVISSSGWRILSRPSGIEELGGAREEDGRGAPLEPGSPSSQSST
jgi:hypothetical protein